LNFLKILNDPVENQNAYLLNKSLELYRVTPCPTPEVLHKFKHVSLVVYENTKEGEPEFFGF
jgi:hypothetical protein